MTAYRLDELVPQLEEKLGISPGFFAALDKDEESDWSFVIKLHALVEAAISHLLTEYVGFPELEKIFARIDISNKATGKAAYVEALGLLSKPERRFMSSLSELRNDLVHDIRNVNFDLSGHVEKMDKAKRETYLNNFNLLSTDVTVEIRTLFFNDPRQALWYSGMAFLGIVYLRSKSGGLRGNAP